MTKLTWNLAGHTGEHSPLNWPITVRILTKRYNKCGYFGSFGSTERAKKNKSNEQLNRSEQTLQGSRVGAVGECLPRSMRPEFDSSRVSHVGWVCCWFSPCFEGFSPGCPVFFPPENQRFQLVIPSGENTCIKTCYGSCGFLSKCNYKLTDLRQCFILLIRNFVITLSK